MRACTCVRVSARACVRACVRLRLRARARVRVLVGSPVAWSRTWPRRSAPSRAQRRRRRPFPPPPTPRPQTMNIKRSNSPVTLTRAENCKPAAPRARALPWGVGGGWAEVWAAGQARMWAAAEVACMRAAAITTSGVSSSSGGCSAPGRSGGRYQMRYNGAAPPLANISGLTGSAPASPGRCPCRP